MCSSNPVLTVCRYSSLLAVIRRARAADLVERELVQPVALSEQMFLYVRQDVVLPDALDGGLVEVMRMK